MRVSPTRFLLQPYNEAWRLVDERGRDVAAGKRMSHVVCATGDGFAQSYGSDVTRHDAQGRLLMSVKAKKRVDGLAAAHGLLVASQIGELELITGT